MYIYIYIYIYMACMHVCTYICIYIYIHTAGTSIIIISVVRFGCELFVYKDRSPLMIMRQSGKQILRQKIVKCGGVH